MSTATLGKTGISISSLGFGAMWLSIDGRPPSEQATAVLQRAVQRGATFIDTADSYCIDEADKHHNERLIAAALSHSQGAAPRIVATKGGLIRPEGRWEVNGDPRHLTAAIRHSFEALGGERPIALWQWHAPDPRYPIEESLLPVRQAVKEGLIQHVGLSNVSVEQIKEARDMLDIVSVQNRYSLWHRQPERDGVLAYCERVGLTFFAYSPLGGRLGAKALAGHGLAVELAQHYGVTPQRIALAWLHTKSRCIVPIPGTTRVEAADQLFTQLNLRLTPDEARALEAAPLPPSA
ncbi:MAG: aldo/keto reductase [Deltaproteobacteria bacterium]|nr:aldo/keto reductase [Deltaproteobacteria bacterium]